MNWKSISLSKNHNLRFNFPWYNNQKKISAGSPRCYLIVICTFLQSSTGVLEVCATNMLTTPSFTSRWINSPRQISASSQCLHVVVGQLRQNWQKLNRSYVARKSWITGGTAAPGSWRAPAVAGGFCEESGGLPGCFSHSRDTSVFSGKVSIFLNSAMLVSCLPISLSQTWPWWYMPWSPPGSIFIYSGLLMRLLQKFQVILKCPPKNLSFFLM